MNNLYENIPAELRSLKQWCRYRTEWDENKKRFQKLPIDPITGHNIVVTQIGNLWSLEEVIKSTQGNGIGFVLTETDHLVGEDFDNVLLDKTTIHSGLLGEIDLSTYVEVTPSGAGLHQFYLCDEPFEAPEPRLTVQGMSWEVYKQGHYLTVTGNVFPGASSIIKKVSADFLRKKFAVRRIVKVLSKDPKAGRLFHERDAWRGFGYPSQSEADFFLLGEIKSLTNDQQIGLRIFQMSALFRGNQKGPNYLSESWEKVKRGLRPVTVESLRVYPNERVEDRFSIWLGSTPIAKPQNITIIRAPRKAGKTHTIHALVAALSEDAGDTLEFRVDSDAVKKIAVVDTEQDRNDICALQNVLETRARREMTEKVHHFSFRGPVARGPAAIEKLEDILKQDSYQIVCLDVLTDFVMDTNSIEEASRVMNDLERLAVEYDCAIVGTIHVGTSPEAKAKGSRGAIGSEVERRAFAVLEIGSAGISVIACRRAQAGEAIAIRWSDELHSFVVAFRQRGAAEKLAASVFEGRDQLSAKELLANVCKVKGVGQSAAQKQIKQMVVEGIIERRPGKVYRIKDGVQF